MEFDCVRAIQLYFMSFLSVFFSLLSLLHPSAYTNQRVCVWRWRWKKNLVEHLKTFILYNGHLFIHNSGGMEKKCTQTNAKQWRKRKKKKELSFKVHTNTRIHYLTGVIFINADYSNTKNVYSSKLLASLVASPHNISQQYHNADMPTCELSLYIFAVLVNVFQPQAVPAHTERDQLSGWTRLGGIISTAIKCKRLKCHKNCVWLLWLLLLLLVVIVVVRN